MIELITSFVQLIIVFGIVFIFFIACLGKGQSRGGTVSSTPRPTFGEREKESIRRAYESLRKVAEMTKKYPINGQSMLVIISSSERSRDFVKFKIRVRYEYETTELKEWMNMEEERREIVLYNFFRETPYEEGADTVKHIVFDNYDVIEFRVDEIIGEHVSIPQIMQEFKTMGIHDAKVESGYASFWMYR